MTTGNVTVKTKNQVLTIGPLYPPDQKEGACIFCNEPGRIRLEFTGEAPGAIFCCDMHKELLLANDVFLEMPLATSSGKVRLFVDGDFIGEVDPGKIE